MRSVLDLASVVRLNSGGPLMTVESLYGASGLEWATCVWFDEKKQTLGNFLVKALVPAQPLRDPPEDKPL
ncbi:MAG: putative small protein [Betaproteobacteria bacterium]|jgi:uncharacterized protein YodC (DUF2158 family)|nr:putative small protein [Betaproteobacteria bacterium]